MICKRCMLIGLSSLDDGSLYKGPVLSAIFESLLRISIHCRRQNLSFFGDIAGVSFSPDDTTLMIGLQDFSNGGMLELVIAD